MCDCKMIISRYIEPIVSNLQLAIIGSLCLWSYYDAETETLKFPCFAYTLLIANALLGFTIFEKEDSFRDLRVLLDYTQLVLVLPLLTSEFLIQNNVFPEDISMFPIYLGLTPLVIFIVHETKRQDLTDLVVISSISLLAIVGIFQQIFALAAAVVFGIAYFRYKRNEGVCARNSDKFKICLSPFAVLSFIALEPQIIFEDLDRTIIER